jgi:hypothetical protein
LGVGEEGRPGAGPEDFPILDESSRLVMSTAPGLVTGNTLGADYQPPTPDQQADNRPGDASVNSLVPYGDYHMRPNRGWGGSHIPPRPWKYASVPDAWIDRWAEEYKQAVAELIPQVISQLR